MCWQQSSSGKIRERIKRKSKVRFPASKREIDLTTLAPQCQIWAPVRQTSLLQVGQIITLQCIAMDTKIVFSGAPGTPRISNNITEVDNSKYKFNWMTPSFTNILEHLLIYKQVKVVMVISSNLSMPNVDVLLYHRKEKYYRT